LFEGTINFDLDTSLTLSACSTLDFGPSCRKREIVGDLSTGACRKLHAMDQVIGVMLVIILIGLLTDKILFAPIERFLHRRWGTGLR
jgi:hypothetical protein